MRQPRQQKNSTGKVLEKKATLLFRLGEPEKSVALEKFLTVLSKQPQWENFTCVVYPIVGKIRLLKGSEALPRARLKRTRLVAGGALEALKRSESGLAISPDRERKPADKRGRNGFARFAL